MTNDGNVSRWLTQGQRFSFESFCFVSAAEDIEYPNGHVVALSAYEAAIRVAAESLKCDIEVKAHEYLTVYHLFKVRAMIPTRLAVQSDSDNRINRTVNDRMQKHFPGTYSTTHIGKTAEKLRLPFIVIWKALPDGWF